MKHDKVFREKQLFKLSSVIGPEGIGQESEGWVFWVGHFLAHDTNAPLRTLLVADNAPSWHGHAPLSISTH